VLEYSARFIFNKTRSIIFFFILVVFATSACNASENTTVSDLDSNAILIANAPFLQILLTLLGSIVVAYISGSAFNSREVKVNNLPMPPRYMTNKRQYQAACAAFVLICIFLYVVVALFHRQFIPALKLLNQPLYEKIHEEVASNSPSYFVVVVFAVGFFIGNCPPWVRSSPCDPGVTGRLGLAPVMG